MNEPAVVSLQGVSKEFRGGTVALQGIDLEVHPREFVSLIGPSGCGKSTLLRIWAETGSTVVFVTHSIPEAVFLSTRVVVMSARPGRVAQVIDVDLPQPRTNAVREEPRFFELVTEVREALIHGGAELVR